MGFQEPFWKKHCNSQLKHIKEFFKIENKKLIESGTEDLSELHHLAYAIILKEDLDEIKSILKPNRGQIAN